LEFGMKGLLLCSIVVGLGCQRALAQTNYVASHNLFSVPHLDLKKLDGEPPGPSSANSAEVVDVGFRLRATSVSAPPSSNSTNGNPFFAGSVALSSSQPGDDFFQRLDLYGRLDRGGYLERPGRPPDGLFERALDSTFRPEVIHMGKTTFSCTLITAIKRKNPLCLLNPIFLQLTW
jgi:hypothetical protein